MISGSRMNHLHGKALLASGFHMPERGNVDHFQNALIVVGNDGTIVSLFRPGDSGYDEQKLVHRDADTLVSLPEGSYLLPGFVDLHVHAPQYPQLGQRARCSARNLAAQMHLPARGALCRHSFRQEELPSAG